MVVKGVLRPGDGPSEILLDLYVRSDAGKVVEVFRIDLGELLRLPPGYQEPDRGCRNFRGVVPSGEGQDEDRTPQLGLFEIVDVCHIVYCAPASRSCAITR